MSEALFSVGPVKVCCSFDPAIDSARSNLAEYSTTRDPKYIHEAEGQRITWFHVQRMKRSRLMEIDQLATSEWQAKITAFRECVIRVDNLTLASGEVHPAWLPEHKTKGDDWGSRKRIIQEAELEHFLREEIYEVGHVALVLSNLRPGRPAFFPPLDTSAHAMAVNAYHRAVEIQAAASRDNAPRSTEPTATATTPNKREPRSGKRGAATAKGHPSDAPSTADTPTGSVA